MKNSEIHNGLDKKEIRDFLSLVMVKSFEKKRTLVKKEIPYENSIDHTINCMEADLEFNQQIIEILKEQSAVVKIIKSQGWSEYDVSDETIKDLPYKLHMCFIGTEEEYNDFKNKL